MTTNKTPDLKEVFKTLNLCSLSYKQEELVQSFEEQFEKNGRLSEKQVVILLDIYEKASS